jgi:hypothetical protein
MSHPIRPAPQANPSAFQIKYQTHNGAWHLGPVLAGDQERAERVCQEVRHHPEIAAAIVVPAEAPALGRLRRLGFPSAQALRRLAYLPLEVIAQHFCLPAAVIAKLFRKHRIGSGLGLRRSLAGYLVRSRYELQVADWLHTEGIAHRYDACIFETRFCCDFKLSPGPVFVEIWGMIGSPEYNARMRDKQKLYREYGADLVELYPNHFRGEHWQEILRRRAGLGRLE